MLLAAFSLFAWVRYDAHVLPAVLRGVDFAAVAFSVLVVVVIALPLYVGVGVVVLWTVYVVGRVAGAVL
ncbi:hypothetical protein [Saccharothrix luteola]|uniref:hypothetical protein n=1 Tax=Saccharothrix luteola TaxID=2893018 RepID=UPI001E29C53B|nr:hypothetical protein [Saccharothrix luteola]MCC8250056.1 hypothetical protein [Saccharothrix luteola]